LRPRDWIGVFHPILELQFGSQTVFHGILDVELFGTVTGYLLDLKP